ncbi:MAG: hypothetical protein J7J86_02170 [Bacteroidales bacterium]|nr:hypothetical protein [Bacteroidales bacterium]
MHKIFKSSVFCGGSLINPEKIEFFSDNTIVYKQNNILNHSQFSISLPIYNIISIDIFPKIFGNQIVIRSFNRSDIIANGFSDKQTKIIKSFITA